MQILKVVMIILAVAIVITLNNTGIINKANTAVDSTDLANVQDLATLKWADAYLDNKRTQEDLEKYVLDELEKEGVVTEDYIINVTKNEVDVKIYPNAGLYATGTNTLLKSWEELVAEGLVVVSDTKEVSAGSDNTLLAGDLVIAKGITSIGIGAFTNCTGLTGITMPSSLTSIGSMAFAFCTGLTEITTPSSLISMGAGAFQSCTGLTKIMMSSGVTSISSGAFYNCTNLTEITLPSSVTSIGGSAFSGCTALTNINYTGTEAEWNAITIDNNGNDALATATIKYNYVVQ